MKSPPELWAEISEVSSLARHLGEFGEIRITKLEPETTVAWEGDTARGTVELQASGWGTKVTLTAELLEAAEPVTAEPVAQPAATPDPEPAATTETVCTHDQGLDTGAHAPVVEPQPAARPEPEPEPQPAAVEPQAAPVKLGFFARLFGRKPKPAPAPEPAAVAVEPEPEPVAVEPEPVAVAPEPEPEPVAVEPEPEPAAAAAAETVCTDDQGLDTSAHAPAAAEPEPEPVAPAATVRRVDHETATAVLTAVLDDLGAAHHRPFSRS